MACSTLPGGVLYSAGRGGGGGGRGAWLRRRTTPGRRQLMVVNAVAAPEDCNEEECAPEKEVGKVSMDWKASESTQVLGTYPPVNKKKWTGYVEKDTAGQTNIYAVEPTVYVSENVISSNTVGDSTEGSEQTLTIAGALALVLLLGAGFVLLSVSTSPNTSAPPAPDAATLSYYIQKFTPVTTTTSAVSSADLTAPAPQPASQLQSSQSEQPSVPLAPASDIPVEPPVVPVRGSEP